MTHEISRVKYGFQTRMFEDETGGHDEGSDIIKHKRDVQAHVLHVCFERGV